MYWCLCVLVKGEEATKHDKLTQKVMKVLGLIGRCVMENPQGDGKDVVHERLGR